MYLKWQWLGHNCHELPRNLPHGPIHITSQTSSGWHPLAQGRPESGPAGPRQPGLSESKFVHLLLGNQYCWLFLNERNTVLCRSWAPSLRNAQVGDF